MHKASNRACGLCNEVLIRMSHAAEARGEWTSGWVHTSDLARVNGCSCVVIYLAFMFCIRYGKFGMQVPIHGNRLLFLLDIADSL